MADIKALLRKKELTGRELGIIEVSNMADTFRQSYTGEEIRPIVPDAEFQRMINSIGSREDARDYQGYLAIHEWLMLRYNISETQYQQAQLRLTTLTHILSCADFTEDVYRYISKLPVIMSERQYQETKSAGIHAWLYDEETGKPRRETLPEVILRTFSYYNALLQTDPRKANPLKAVRKKYLGQPVESRMILDRYNEAMGEGYCTLPDGRRSDEMTMHEWLMATGAVCERPEIIMRRATERARVMFSGGTPEEAEQAQKEIDAGTGIKVEWHPATEPPEDLTKWDVVECDNLDQFYPGLFGGTACGEEQYTAELEDFLAEFGELAEALAADISRRYLTGERALAIETPSGARGTPIKNILDIPRAEWARTTFTLPELYRVDFYGIQREAESPSICFKGNQQAQDNGVAIFMPGMSASALRSLDAEGNYRAPNIREALARPALRSLESFLQESEEYEDAVDRVKNARRLLMDSLYYLNGYNTALDLIAEHFDIPAISVFKQPVDTITYRVEAMNSLVPVLYAKIADTEYQDRDLQQRKLRALQDYFPILDHAAQTPPKENIEKAKELLAGYKAFIQGERDLFEQLLFTPPQRDEGGAI